MSSDKPSLGSRLGGIIAGAKTVAETAGRALAATGELIRDGELRRKGAAYIASEASKGIQELQHGIESSAKSALDGISSGTRPVQSLLRNLERQISVFQAQQAARDLADELEHHRKLPVDIQMGNDVYEDMPQEMRSRLWAALLAQPDLGKPFRPLTGRAAMGAASSRPPTTAGGAAEGPEQATGAAAEGGGAEQPAAGVGSGSAVDEGCDAEPAAAPQPPAAPSPWTTAEGGQAAEPAPGAAPAPAAPPPAGGGSPLGPAAGPRPHPPPHLRSVFHERAQREPSYTTSSPLARQAARASAQMGGLGDEWEVVAGDAVPVLTVSGEVETLETLRSIAGSLEPGGGGTGELDLHRASKQALFHAMLEVPWVPGEGVPCLVDPEGEYTAMLAAAEEETAAMRVAGDESVSDVIRRDINRTFPEHPLYTTRGEGEQGLHSGQQKLLRVLQAYAAKDTEVGYCQGMAFAAGVLLMYLPEEPAYQLYCRLMGPEGCNLRRLYLPGLAPLKAELSRFELLLATHLPALHEHLMEAGLPSVLYASQWIMTLFAAPFPVHFAARMLDIFLLDMSADVLPRTALAVMAALQEELLALEDFEALITHLKVRPVQWKLHNYRSVLAAALASPADDEELHAANAAVAAEAVRLGRESSFRGARLSRLETVNGSSFVGLERADGSWSRTDPEASAGRQGEGSLGLGDTMSNGGRGGGAGAAAVVEPELAADETALLEMMLDMRLLLPGGGESVDETGMNWSAGAADGAAGAGEAGGLPPAVPGAADAGVAAGVQPGHAAATPPASTAVAGEAESAPLQAGGDGAAADAAAAAAAGAAVEPDPGSAGELP